MTKLIGDMNKWNDFKEKRKIVVDNFINAKRKSAGLTMLMKALLMAKFVINTKALLAKRQLQIET